MFCSIQAFYLKVFYFNFLFFKKNFFSFFVLLISLYKLFQINKLLIIFITKKKEKEKKKTFFGLQFF